MRRLRKMSKCARDQCSIFSLVQLFWPDYGLLLELRALTLVYALLQSGIYYLHPLVA